MDERPKVPDKIKLNKSQAILKPSANKKTLKATPKHSLAISLSLATNLSLASNQSQASNQSMETNQNEATQSLNPGSNENQQINETNSQTATP